MKIEISQPKLASVLGAVAGVVERRQTLPILANVLLKADEGHLSLSATDLEIGVQTETPCEVVEPGNLTVPARKLSDFCRSLPASSTVKIKSDGERCVVSSGRTRFTLTTLPAADFPEIATDEDLRSLSMSVAELKAVLDKTAFAMAQQDVRYYLNGVMLEFGGDELIAVATDGHRLSMVRVATDLPAGERDQIILPAKTVSELRRLLGDTDERVSVQWGARSIVLTFGGIEIRSKLVDGKYPEYERVVPRGLERTAVVERDAVRAALQRAAILSNEKYKGVRVSFGAGGLALQAQNPEHEVAEDEVAAEYDGETVTIGFNVSYLMDALQAIDAERVEVGFKDSDSSTIWRGEGRTGETFVVMPMRL